ncbi:hypothetical protein GobsT_64310 [Gemmata obscuriglobus]|nr:hypothetical protein GobsT_64310 [Gemmata obscuriglobus]VTS10950.1 unnamed protein product [Gemmata obscuriglobus UQM 2246]
MAKSLQPPKPEDENSPLADGGDAEDPKYTAHLKVPLEFMERLTEIAHKINKRRRRQGRKKRALGWFVVTHLEGWMNRAEAELQMEEEEGS